MTTSDLIGLAGVAISLALAFYFWLYPRELRPRLSFLMQDIDLLGKPGDISRLKIDDDDIRVTFRGAPVDRLISTRIAIWNGGAKTIRAEDVVSPITCTFAGDVQILRASLDKITRSENAFAMDASGSKIAVSFRFLDKGDGASIEVLHTAERPDVRISGSIIGAPVGFVDAAEKKARVKHFLLTVAALVFAVGALVSAQETKTPPTHPIFAIVGFLITALSGLIIGIAVMPKPSPYPKALRHRHETWVHNP